MNNVLHPYLEKKLMVFIDDILIYPKNEEEHENHLEIILRFLTEHKLYVKLSKCNLFQTQVHYLGHVVSKDGIAADLKKD